MAGTNAPTGDLNKVNTGFWRKCTAVGWKLLGVVETKAHRDLATVEREGSPADIFQCKGTFADAHCKLGAEQNLPPHGDIQAVGALQRRIHQVFLIFANVLPTCPPSRETHGELARARTSGPKAKLGNRSPHKFAWVGATWQREGNWQCKQCLRAKKKPSSGIDSEPCGEMPPSLRNLFESGNPGGHLLRITQISQRGFFPCFLRSVRSLCGTKGAKSFKTLPTQTGRLRCY